MNRSKPRIGVYVCRCGTNISATVDVEQVVAHAEKLGNVELVKEYSYMCSDPGQDLIKEDIQEHNLNRVVVASCSPLMHEETFRQAVREGGVNPFYFQMANIREQCSWVIPDHVEATEKAKNMVESAVSRVYFHRPLEEREVDMEPSVLVVGAGISGIEASLKLADAGKKVYLVERESSIGGHMSQLYKTFPTLDCAA
ncbi:MAG: FAD-dependent oxidoreductase [Chloroflexota bacterium]